MIKIYYNNKPPKRSNKKQVEKLEVLIIKNEEIDELLEEIHRRDKFDTEFGIDDDVNEGNTIDSDNSEHINGE